LVLRRPGWLDNSRQQLLQPDRQVANAHSGRVIDGVGDGSPAVPMLASWPMPLMRPDRSRDRPPAPEALERQPQALPLVPATRRYCRGREARWMASRRLSGFRSGPRQLGASGSLRLDGIGVTSVGPRRSKQAILALHQHLGLASGLPVTLGKIDRRPKRFPLAWIRTRVAVSRANFPFAVALGDEILGTSRHDSPCGYRASVMQRQRSVGPNGSSARKICRSKPQSGRSRDALQTGTFIAKATFAMKRLHSDYAWTGAPIWHLGRRQRAPRRWAHPDRATVTSYLNRSNGGSGRRKPQETAAARLA
jgi:hypothetical protein